VNGTSYTYAVRYNNGCGMSSTTTGVSAADVYDAVTTAPLITSIVDNNPTVQDGIFIHYTAGSPATSHDLYRDTLLVVPGYVSGTLYNPGDTNSHDYVVRAINGPCWADSAVMAGIDAAIGTPPAEVFYASWTGKTQINWGVEATADTYNLYHGLRADLVNLANANPDFCTYYAGPDTFATVADNAPLGDCYYFLVTGVNGAGEGSAGTDSNGIERQVNTTGSCL